MANISKVTTNGPLKLVKAGQDFNMIIVAPQTNAWGWGYYPNTFNPTDSFINSVISTYKVDKSRVYMTGLSMGGAGSWDYANFASGKLAAIVPIAGAGQYKSTVCNLKNRVAVWIFVNSNDPEPTASASSIYNGFIIPLDNNCGSPVPDTNIKYTQYTASSHGGWTQTYDGTGMGTENKSYDLFDQSIYSWMLQFSKTCINGICTFYKNGVSIGTTTDADNDQIPSVND